MILERRASRIPHFDFFKTFKFYSGAQIKPFQTFSIILPNLIHKSKKRNLKKDKIQQAGGEVPACLFFSERKIYP